MYIIDRIEHGNMGVCGHRVLAEMSLAKALKTKPSDFGIYEKMWGFYPVISRTIDINNYSYQWIVDDDTEQGSWVKSEKKKKRRGK